MGKIGVEHTSLMMVVALLYLLSDGVQWICCGISDVVLWIL